MKNVNVKNYKELQDALIDFIYSHEATVIKVDNVRYKFYLSVENGLYVVKHGKTVKELFYSFALTDYVKDAVHNEKFNR